MFEQCLSYKESNRSNRRVSLLFHLFLFCFSRFVHLLCRLFAFCLCLHCLHVWITKASVVMVSWRLIITCIAFHFISFENGIKHWSIEAWICYNFWTVSHSFRFSFHLTRDKRTHTQTLDRLPWIFSCFHNLNICNIHLYLSCVRIQC